MLVKLYQPNTSAIFSNKMRLSYLLPLSLIVACFTIVRPSPGSQIDRRAQTMNFIAGGIAGSLSSTITTPLEGIVKFSKLISSHLIYYSIVIKTQMQSSRVGGRYEIVETYELILYLCTEQTYGCTSFFRHIKARRLHWFLQGHWTNFSTLV